MMLVQPTQAGWRSALQRTARAVLAMALLWAGLSQVALAVDPPKGWEPRTGDTWIDGRLEDINHYGQRYPDAFIDELVRYQDAPEALAREMLTQRDWKPGDLYYACAMAQAIGQSCRSVIAEWNRDHGKGWAGVGKRLGIAPGSRSFHKVKRGFVASYDHWARPLTLDAELRRAFPRHGKNVGRDAGKAKKTQNK